MRSHATGGTSAVLLGLPEFVALSANEVAGEAELLVETTVTLTGRPRCGVVAESHGRRAMLVQDLPAAGRPVGPSTLHRNKRTRHVWAPLSGSLNGALRAGAHTATECNSRCRRAAAC